MVSVVLERGDVSNEDNLQEESMRCSNDDPIRDDKSVRGLPGERWRDDSLGLRTRPERKERGWKV